MSGFGGTTWSGPASTATVGRFQLRGRSVVLLLVLEAVLTVGLILAGGEVGAAVALLIAGGALITTLLFVLPESEREPLLAIFGLGLMLRVTVLIVMEAILRSPANPYGFLFPDSFGYDRVGLNIADHWRAGRPARIEYQTAGFTIGYHYFVALLYAVVGHLPLFVKAVNVLLSASLVPLTFLLGRRLAGKRVGLTAAMFMAVWPPILFWSAQMLKDALIAFLLLSAVLGWVGFVRRPRLVALVMAVLPAIPLLFLRTYMFLFWAISLAAGFFVWARERGQKLVAMVLALAVAAGGIWGALQYSALRFGDLDVWVSKISAVGTMEGSVFSGVFYRSIGDLLAFYPLGFIRFLLTPLPWKADPLYWPEAVGSVLRYILLPFAPFGLLYLLRKERSAVFPILVIGFLAVSIYATAFRGGGPRHMTQLYPYLFVAAAAGFGRFPSWPLPVAVGWIAFLGAVAALGLA